MIPIRVAVRGNILMFLSRVFPLQEAYRQKEMALLI